MTIILICHLNFFSGSYHKSPLLPAIQNGYLSMVKLLLAKGAMLQDKIIMEKDCLLFERVNFLIVKYFLKRGANPTAKNDDGDTLLHKECGRGNWKHAKYIIKQNKEYVPAKNGKGQTLLQIVCRRYCYGETQKLFKMVKFLIEEQNADPVATCNEGKTALHYAARNNEPGFVKYLIEEQKQDIEATDNEGKTAFHISSQSTPMAGSNNNKYLIEKYPKIIEAKDKKGKTALHYCLQKFKNARKERSYLFIPIALIVATKAKILKTRENKDTDHIYEWIKQSYNSGMEKCKKDDEAISCLIAGLQCFQKQFYEKNKTYIEKNPLLYIVDYCNRVDIAKFMFSKDLCYIENNLNLEEANLKRNLLLESYLAFSCYHGLLDLTKFLFQERSDRHAYFQHLKLDGSFLKLACYHSKDFDLFKYLLEDEKAKDEADEFLKVFPLDFYSKIGTLEMVKYLIETKKMNVEVKNNRGKTLLHLACHAGSTAIAKYLIETQNANINTTDNMGRSLLHSACQSRCLEVVKYISQKTKLDVNAQDDNGSTALHLACKQDKPNLTVVKFLITDMKANLHSVDKEGRTPLHVAETNAKSKFLISKGANVLAKDNRGYSPLHTHRFKLTINFLKAATKR